MRCDRPQDATFPDRSLRQLLQWHYLLVYVVLLLLLNEAQTLLIQCLNLSHTGEVAKLHPNEGSLTAKNTIINHICVQQLTIKIGLVIVESFLPSKIDIRRNLVVAQTSKTTFL